MCLMVVEIGQELMLLWLLKALVIFLQVRVKGVLSVVESLVELLLQAFVLHIFLFFISNYL